MFILNPSFTNVISNARKKIILQQQINFKNKIFANDYNMNVNEKDRWVDINKPDVVESTCRCLRKTRRTPDGRGLCSINPLRYNLWTQFKLLAKPNSPHRLFGRPVQSRENKLRGGAELRGITGPFQTVRPYQSQSCLCDQLLHVLSMLRQVYISSFRIFFIFKLILEEYV